MTIKTQKHMVLERLNEQKEPIQLSALLKLLGVGYKERTVRRWLNEWLQTGVVIKTGQNRSTYYISANMQTSQEISKVPFSQNSLRILDQVKQPYFLRKPVSYQEAWLKDYRPNIDSYLSTSLKEQLQKAGKRSRNAEPAGTYARHIYQRLLIDLSYHSSRLEGNTYSLLDTKRLLIDGIDVPGKLDEEKTMILNHKEAIRFLVENPVNLTPNINTIYTLHYLLSDGLVIPNYSGNVRDYGV